MLDSKAAAQAAATAWQHKIWRLLVQLPINSRRQAPVTSLNFHGVKRLLILGCKRRLFEISAGHIMDRVMTDGLCICVYAHQLNRSGLPIMQYGNDLTSNTNGVNTDAALASFTACTYWTGFVSTGALRQALPVTCASCLHACTMLGEFAMQRDDGKLKRDGLQGRNTAKVWTSPGMPVHVAHVIGNGQIILSSILQFLYQYV